MQRLLVIESVGSSPDGDVRAILERERGFQCDGIGWDTLSTDAPRGRDAALIVAVLSDDRDRMFVSVRSLANHLPGKPILGVLPALSQDDYLSSIVPLIDDFVIRPVGSSELGHRVARLAATVPRHDEAAVSARLIDEMTMTRLVGRDPVFLRAVQEVPRFARFDMSVLITGETGTGKELCARALHHLSPRRNNPFVAVDCGAVPDTLFENELFGHTRGAYTDAHRAHKGLVAMADGGTLFLDEIDALSLAAQAKLLRFLQEHTFRALGSDRYDRADVRVIAATNRDLDSCVRNKQLRSDLFFRLNVLRLHLPPLRERPGDIPLLAQSVLKEYGASTPGTPTAFSSAALRVLAAHHWPGNVRELSNVVQRAMVACDGTTIQPSHITIGEESAASSPAPAAIADFRSARRAALDAFERRYVEDLLRKHRGNVTHAAREAQQDRRAFGRFIKKYQINRVLV